MVYKTFAPAEIEFEFKGFYFKFRSQQRNLFFNLELKGKYDYFPDEKIKEEIENPRIYISISKKTVSNYGQLGYKNISLIFLDEEVTLKDFFIRNREEFVSVLTQASKKSKEKIKSVS